VYACGDARVGRLLIVTAIAEGRKCARIVNKDLGGSPTDADREMFAIGAWSGEADRTLRHDAEAPAPSGRERSSSAAGDPPALGWLFSPAVSGLSGGLSGAAPHRGPERTLKVDCAAWTVSGVSRHQQVGDRF
jgi:hypothetical protein